MQAAQINEYGGKDVLVIADVPQPAITDDQVLVAVKAAAMNPFDWKVREGFMKDFIPLEFPATLGGDVAGTVEQIGENVTGFTIGQSVYGSANAVSGHGSFAEFAPVSAKQLVAKPESIAYETAAAMTLVGVSAYQAIVDHIKLQPDQKILINGGAGGIGSLAIQLAKNIGAHVATTVSSNDVDYAKELGADQVIDYSQQDFSTIIADYDAVFDTVGGEATEKSYAVLKPGGTLVSMANQPDEALVAKHGVTFVSQQSTPTVERLTSVAQLVESGVLTVRIDQVFSLDDAAEALEYVKTGHPAGKVVLKVGD